MSNMEPRRRTEPVNVGRARPVRRVVWEEDEQLSWADRRLDRANQSRHIVDVRETRREAEERATEINGAAAVATAAIEAKRKYLYEVKQQIARARQESEMLARGDVALMAEFSQLDEDLYQTARMYGLELDD